MWNKVSKQNNKSENDTASRIQSGSGDSATGPDPLTLSKHIKQPGAAPVHLWDPPYCGEMDMRIARDGTWYHEGRPIRRDALVTLFSSVLKKEGERYFLVTPVEKVGIQVEDCPFVARTADISGSGKDLQVRLVLNTGEQVPMDSQHPLEVIQHADHLIRCFY